MSFKDLFKFVLWTLYYKHRCFMGVFVGITPFQSPRCREKLKMGKRADSVSKKKKNVFFFFLLT